MVKVYLSPSTQPNNLYWDKKHDEELVMNLVTDALVAFLSNYDVDIIRGSKGTDTYTRIRNANQLQVDYYLAIHSNAGGGKGCETFFQVGKNHTAVVKAKSKAYAEKINRDFSMITPSNTKDADRGIKSGTLSDGRDYNHEMRGVLVPANLIELEFHDTEIGCKWILANIQKAGETLAKSIVDLFDLKLKTTIPDDHYFFVQVGAYKTLTEAQVEGAKVARATGKEVGVKYGSKHALQWIKSVK